MSDDPWLLLGVLLFAAAGGFGAMVVAARGERRRLCADPRLGALLARTRGNRPEAVALEEATPRRRGRARP